MTIGNMETTNHYLEYNKQADIEPKDNPVPKINKDKKYFNDIIRNYKKAEEKLNGSDIF